MTKFTDNSAQILEQIRNAMSAAIGETAEEVGAIAQKNAPVRSGALRDSKLVEIGFLVAWVGFTAKHSAWVAVGTSRQAANPFFLLALYKAKDILLKKFSEKVRKQLR